jgi:hypothetical protein
MNNFATSPKLTHKTSGKTTSAQLAFNNPCVKTKIHFIPKVLE